MFSLGYTYMYDLFIVDNCKCKFDSLDLLLYLAVVNLTLIDLPGMTKVAVGKHSRKHTVICPDHERFRFLVIYN